MLTCGKDVKFERALSLPCQASEVDKSIFRFFMIPKEIQMMSFQLRLQGNLSKDDGQGCIWSVYAYDSKIRWRMCNLITQICKIQQEDPLITDGWMLQVALRFSPHMLGLWIVHLRQMFLICRCMQESYPINMGLGCQYGS